MSKHTHTTTSSTSATGAGATDGARRAYLGVIGLAAVVILLQAVWAGLFIHEGEDYKDSWVPSRSEWR